MNSLTKSFDKRSYAWMTRRLETQPKAWLATEDIVTALVANSREPIPEALLAHLRQRLDGTARKPRGRKKDQSLTQPFRLLLAAEYYDRLLPWLQKRQTTCGLVGWSCIRSKPWWHGPPSERAARIIGVRLKKNADWRHILNLLSQPR